MAVLLEEMLAVDALRAAHQRQRAPGDLGQGVRRATACQYSARSRLLMPGQSSLVGMGQAHRADARLAARGVLLHHEAGADDHRSRHAAPTPARRPRLRSLDGARKYGSVRALFCGRSRVRPGCAGGAAAGCRG